MSSIKRFFFKISRASRNRGFGIQSPFAYRFVREVARNKYGSHDNFSMTLKDLSKEEIRLKRFYFRLERFLKDYENIDHILIIEGIHKTKKAYINWKEIIKDETVRVSFDLYDCGVLFFDEKMYKRNYKAMLR